MKKGFTLVELLAVITVLGLLAAISIPIVNNQINSSKDKAYKNQVQTIVNAAKRWGFDNDNLLNTTEKTTVSIIRIIIVTINNTNMNILKIALQPM